MNYALVFIAERVDTNIELSSVIPQGLNLRSGGGIHNWQVNVLRRSVVILSGDCQISTPDVPAGLSQTIKSLRASYFMNQMQIDI